MQSGLSDMRMSHAKVTCEWTLFADITQYVQFFVNYFLSSIYHAEFRKHTRFHKDQLQTYKNMAPLTYKAMYVRMRALSPSTHFFVKKHWQILDRVPISFPNLNYWIRQDESSGGDYFLFERKSWKSVRHRYKGPLTPRVHVLTNSSHYILICSPKRVSAMFLCWLVGRWICDLH